MIIGIENIIKFYTLDSEEWIISKQLTDSNAISENTFEISADGQTIIIANGVKVFVYIRSNNGYIRQATLSFEEMEESENKNTHLQLSSDGNTLIWCNSNVIEIAIRNGNNWLRRTPIIFEHRVSSLSLNCDGGNLIVCSEGKLYQCN